MLMSVSGPNLEFTLPRQQGRLIFLGIAIIKGASGQLEALECSLLSNA